MWDILYNLISVTMIDILCNVRCPLQCDISFLMWDILYNLSITKKKSTSSKINSENFAIWSNAIHINLVKCTLWCNGPRFNLNEKSSSNSNSFFFLASSHTQIHLGNILLHHSSPAIIWIGQPRFGRFSWQPLYRR